VPEDLDFLLRHVDGCFRLLAAARTAIPLALHRWRLSGEMTEVGTDDLAFTAAEAAHLMVAYGIELPEADLNAVRDRTEGWAAGLRLLLTLAMYGHPDPARWVGRFTGNERSIAEYLDVEVLAGQPPDVRQIMLSTLPADQWPCIVLCRAGGGATSDPAGTVRWRPPGRGSYG
jgi:LuxR family maltose regulon positive regulatory protein